MKSLILAALPLFVLSRQSGQPVTSTASNTEMRHRIDGVVDQAIAEKRIVGAVILVERDGKIVYHRAAGYADREARKPVREDTIFRLASMTKAIVSTSALSMVERGKISLDDPVTKWLPDFKPKLGEGSAPTITIRHLLTHTAGLSYSFSEPKDSPYRRLGVSDGMDSSGITLDENVRRIGEAPLFSTPGTAWRYSVGIDVLGAVLEKAGGATLPEIVRKTVTEPLHMSHTSFGAAESDRLAVPYGDGTPEPVRMTDPYMAAYGDSFVAFSPARAFDKTAFPSGGAGMIGTAGDYLRFLEALRTGGKPILSAKSVEQMTSNQIGDIPVTASGPGWGWGLAFAIVTDPVAAKTPMNPGTWRWGGAYGHYYFVDPTAKLTVVVLTNTAFAGMTGRFPDDIRDAIYGTRAAQ